MPERDRTTQCGETSAVERGDAGIDLAGTVLELTGTRIDWYSNCLTREAD